MAEHYRLRLHRLRRRRRHGRQAPPRARPRRRRSSCWTPGPRSPPRIAATGGTTSSSTASRTTTPTTSTARTRPRGDIQWGYEGSRVMAYGGSTLHWGAWCAALQAGGLPAPDEHRRGRRLADLLRGPRGLLLRGRGVPVGLRRRRRELEPAPGRPALSRARSSSWTAADGVMIEAIREGRHRAGQDADRPIPQVHDDGHVQVLPVRLPLHRADVLDELLRADPRHANFEQRCLSPRHAARRRRRSSDRGDRVPRRGDRRDPRASTPTRSSSARARYESAKLLMRSVELALGARGIGNDHDLVGRYIVSHSFLRVMGTIRRRTPSHWIQEYDFPTLMSRTYDTAEYQKDGKIFLFKNRVLPNVDIAKLMIERQIAPGDRCDPRRPDADGAAGLLRGEGAVPTTGSSRSPGRTASDCR